MARVLVVDDSRLDRELIKEALSGTPHEIVAECGNGEEAVARYRDLAPDLVLMDLVMPRLSGTDAARAILEADPAARIIAVSGLAQPSIMMEAEEIGMTGFLSKPFERDELIAELEEALG